MTFDEAALIMMSGGANGKVKELTITADGYYPLSAEDFSAGYIGYNPVHVAVPQITQKLVVTENGRYNCSNYDNIPFNPIEVNVPTAPKVSPFYIFGPGTYGGGHAGDDVDGLNPVIVDTPYSKYIEAFDSRKGELLHKTGVGWPSYSYSDYRRGWFKLNAGWYIVRAQYVGSFEEVQNYMRNTYDTLISRAGDATIYFDNGNTLSGLQINFMHNSNDSVDTVRSINLAAWVKDHFRSTKSSRITSVNKTFTSADGISSGSIYRFKSYNITSGKVIATIGKRQGRSYATPETLNDPNYIETDLTFELDISSLELPFSTSGRAYYGRYVSVTSPNDYSPILVDESEVPI